MTDAKHEHVDVADAIQDLFRRANSEPPGQPRCAVLTGASQLWSTPSSDVTSSPVLLVSRVFQGQSTRIAVSLVQVRYSVGTGEEALHYHSSHVAGVAIAGRGWLRIPGADGQPFERLLVDAGDVILIPKGGLHLFECEPSEHLDYIALELSDEPIDYQQHRKMT